MGGSVFTQSALASINLIWPSNGQILSKFDSNKKGIQIAGVLGTPVVAAANTCIQATPPIPSGFKLTFDVLAYDQTNKDFYVRWKGTGYSFMYYSSKEGVARVSFR